MRTVRLTVDDDGRVTLPDTQPGQTVAVHVETTAEVVHGPIPDDEWEAIRARVKRRAWKVRKRLPEPWLSTDHGDLVYGEDGNRSAGI